MTTTHGADARIGRPAAEGPERPIAASIEGVGKTFVTKKRRVDALHDINLAVAEGEYVVVLGPSGCGKTTLIRCVAGLESPTQGRIGLQGTAMFDAGRSLDLPPNKRNVGLVFQNYALWPHMTIERNVAYPLRMRKVPKGDRAPRVEEVLKALECIQLAKRLPAELSGGQQQRVALARALVSEPGILLLDEPLSNLDALLRISLRAELLRLHRKLGFTAIHITHDQEEALEMGDRVVLMRTGGIEQVGHPADVYARPVSPYAANFLGVRDSVAVTVGDGLEFSGGRIRGDLPVSEPLQKGEELSFWVREQDVAVGRSGRFEPDAGKLVTEGVLAQVVLGAGGRPRYIVDVGGKHAQWYAAVAATDVQIGDSVTIAINAERALIYRGDTLISR